LVFVFGVIGDMIKSVTWRFINKQALAE